MEKALPHNHGTLSKNIQADMPLETTFNKVADLFKLMSDVRRIQIFWLLCHCEECVTNISAIFEISSPAVSHHLKLLKTAGLVISRREGKEVYYTSAKTPYTEVLHSMTEKVLEVACPLKEAFEEEKNYTSFVGTVNEVQRLLTENLNKRYTIEELSQIFHINTTTLKTEFKRVFGSPIATYMKEYRVKKAVEYLRSKDMSIGEISLAVGYENPGKFTKVFKEITGILPKDYRKRK